jgi:hypothetical protein
MTRETIYVVQSFNAGKGRSLKADVPIPCRSAETARRTAERLAPAKAGVVTFSTAGDAELGDYDDEPPSSSKRDSCRHISRRHERTLTLP